MQFSLEKEDQKKENGFTQSIIPVYGLCYKNNNNALDIAYVSQLVRSVFDDKNSMVVLCELSSLFVKMLICDALSLRILFNDMIHAK